MRAYSYTHGGYNLFDSEKLKVFLELLTGFEPFDLQSNAQRPTPNVLLSQPVTPFIMYIFHYSSVSSVFVTVIYLFIHSMFYVSLYWFISVFSYSFLSILSIYLFIYFQCLYISSFISLNILLCG